MLLSEKAGFGIQREEDDGGNSMAFAQHLPFGSAVILSSIMDLNTICKIIITESEKAMVPHSSTLAWKIPWTEEPGGLQSMGSLRVGHD